MNRKKNGRKIPEWALETVADAQAYLDHGHEAWREADSLASPQDELDPEDLELLDLDRQEVLDGYRIGMEQLAAGLGLDREHPLEGLDIDGFYRLARLMHWEQKLQKLANSSPTWIIDEMILEHAVTGERITLFNKVPTPSALRAAKGGKTNQ